MDNSDLQLIVVTSYFYRKQKQLKESHLQQFIENFQELSTEMRLNSFNGLPGQDYLPRKLINRMGRLNNFGTSRQLQDDVTTIVYNFLTRGLKVINLVRTNEQLTQNEVHLRNLLLKYQFHREERKKRTITPERLYICFPHLAARAICMDMVFISPIDTRIFIPMGFSTVSPACHLMSSFSLLPQYSEDVDDKYMVIVKAMLLYQFELQLRENVHNRYYIQRTCDERMDRVISQAKIINESTHINANLRWFSYTAFFIRTLCWKGFHNYDVAAAKFEKRFKSHVPLVEHVFALKPGSGRTNKHVKEVSLEKIWRYEEYYEDYQVLFRNPPPQRYLNANRPRMCF